MATAAPITATIRLGTGIPFVDGRVVAPVARCYISCRWIAIVVVCQQEWLTSFSYPLILEIVSLTQKNGKGRQMHFSNQKCCVIDVRLSSQFQLLST